MKEKFKNLSTPVGIVLSIVAVILFTGLLLGLGFVLGKIPGLNEQNDYLLQAIAEFIILIVFLIITFVIGYTRIFTENVAGWLRSLYTGGFFVVYCTDLSLRYVKSGKCKTCFGNYILYSCYFSGWTGRRTGLSRCHF